MSYELEYNDIEYDTGYGVHCGDLIFDASPIFTDERFDAYNGSGVLQLYGDANALTDWELDGDATLFLVGNNGQEIGEIVFTTKEEILQYVSNESILDDLCQKHY